MSVHESPGNPRAEPGGGPQCRHGGREPRRRLGPFAGATSPKRFLWAPAYGPLLLTGSEALRATLCMCCNGLIRIPNYGTRRLAASACTLGGMVRQRPENLGLVLTWRFRRP